MNPLENFRMAFEALSGNRLRSFLALLGIVIGVFAVTTMVSLGEMASAGITRDIEGIAGRSIFIQPDFNNGANFDSAPIRDEDIQSLQALPVRVIPQLFGNIQYEPKPGDRRSLQLQGTPGDLPSLDPTTKIARGRYFSASEARGGLPLAVLSDRAAKDLFPNRDPIGQVARLFFTDGSRADLTVVGVLEPPSGIFGGFGSSSTIYAPIPYLWASGNFRRDRYDFVLLSLNKGADAVQVQNQVRRIFENRYGKGKYSIQSTESFQSTLRNITLILQALLGAIAGLSLLVGGIGIMNIMLVTVTERTREIGIRMSLGASRRAVLLQFLLEAILISVGGGILGIIAGVAMPVTVNLLQDEVHIPISVLSIVVAFGVSFVVGIIFGLLPANRASRLNPTEALRYE